MKIRAVVLCLSIVSSAACSESRQELTDSEIIQLVGERWFSEDLTLSKQLVECVRLMGGLDRDVYKAAGDAYLGKVQTECRRQLNRKLENKQRNPKGISLAYFENPKVGERLAEMFKQQQEDERRKADEERAKQEAQRRAEAEASLAKVRAELKDLAAELDRTFQSVTADCAEWTVLRDKLVKKDSWSHWRMTLKPGICAAQKQSEIRNGINRAIQTMGELTVDAVLASYRMPDLGPGDPSRVRNELLRLSASLSEARADAQKQGIPVSVR